MIKDVVKGLFYSVGLEIKRLSPTKSPLLLGEIDLVFDVGANTGQYVSLIRAEGYQGRVVSFEPLPDAYATLTKRAAKDPGWIVHSRCAIGSAQGVATINVSANSRSSSILGMHENHQRAAQESKYIGTVETEVITLDSVLETYRKASEKVFLKVDTQGFEAEVLKGASSTLAEVSGIELELSTVPLYQGQELYPYFIEILHKEGFSLWSISPVLNDPETGRTLQFDATFVRSEV